MCVRTGVSNAHFDPLVIRHENYIGMVKYMYSAVPRALYRQSCTSCMWLDL